MAHRRKKLRIPSRHFQELMKNDDEDRNTEENLALNTLKQDKRGKQIYQDLFPKWLPWLCVVFLLIIRINYVIKQRNWWILHPDEVFQGIEVAHSLVHGYGFRMYEYLPPIVRNRTTAAEDQESSLGIYSLKSFIYPYLYTPILYLVKYTNYNWNSFIVCKVVHATVTSFLPFSVYRFTAALFHCTDIAVMASVFVTLSLHINVFSTHTFLNSFVSPIFFLAVSEILFFGEKNSSLVQKTLHQSRTKKRDVTFQSKVVKNIKSVMCWISSALFGVKLGHNPSEAESVKSGDNFSVVLVSLASFTLGVMIYIHLDLLLPFVALTVMEIVRYPSYITQYKEYWKRYSYIKGGITLALFCGGFVDKMTYGSWFLSPVQWIRLSFIRDMSSRNSDFQPLQYLDYLNENRSCTWLNSLAFLVIFLTLKRSGNKWPTISVLTTLACMMIIYSIQWHKEPRIIFNVYVFICILWSVAMKTASDFLKMWKQNILAVSMITLIWVAFAAESYRDFPDSKSSKWSNNNLEESASINKCLNRIGYRGDVTGVFVDHTLYATGGFSVLNKDVPIIVKMQHEYYEYDIEDRPLYRSGLDVGIRAMNRMSDIIHSLSSKYLHRILSTKKQYNYIITSTPEKYLSHSFSSIFACKSVSALKRTTQKQTKKMKDKDNGTFSPLPDVLEYEGSWLLTIGHYRKSSERLRASLSYGSTRVRPYQLLGLCYYKSGNYSAVKEIEVECYGRYGQKKCDKPQPRLILNQNFNIVA